MCLEGAGIAPLLDEHEPVGVLLVAEEAVGDAALVGQAGAPERDQPVEQLGAAARLRDEHREQGRGRRRAGRVGHAPMAGTSTHLSCSADSTMASSINAVM